MKQQAIVTTISTWILLVFLLGLLGCRGGNSEGLAEEGEACEKTADCAEDLRCLDQVCVPGGDGDTDTEADGGAPDEDLSDLLFDPATIVEVEIEMAPADWDLVRNEVRDISGLFESPCLQEPFYSNYTFKPAAVTVNRERFEQAGVRKKGFLDLPDDELEAALQALIDLDEFMRFWAVESLVNHGDGYATNRNNYYIYFDPTTGLASFMPWGADQVFKSSKFNDGVTSVGSTLTRRLYGLPATQAQYVTVMQELLDTIWDESALLAWVDRMEALVEPVVGHELSGQTDQIRNYISGRRATFGPFLAHPPAFDDPFPPVPCEEFGGGGGKP